MKKGKNSVGDDTSYVNPESDETIKDPKTGKTISKKNSMFMTGGAMMAGAAFGNLSPNQDISEILLDSDGDGIADTTLTDTNNDGVYEATTDIPDENPAQEDTTSQAWNPNTAPMASPGTVSDNMSFSEAFGSAREELGAGGVFVWQGEYYNTFYAEELDDNNHPTVDYQTTDHHGLPEIEYDEGFPEDISGNEVLGQDEDIMGSNTEPHILAVDFDTDGNVDAVFVDINQDGSADIMYTDLNQDGQISDDEFVVIHDPSTLVIPESPSDGSMMSVDMDADGIDDLLIADVDSDQMVDMIGIDENRDQQIEESEITILNPDAMENTSFGPAEIDYSGEVSSDMPDDVTDDVLDEMNDDLSNLEDNFDEINDWS